MNVKLNSVADAGQTWSFEAQRPYPFVPLPHLILILWLVFIGIETWSYALRTAQPPLYDALGYYEKAHNVWTQLRSPHLKNPLNVEPTLRPPGTVLLSYPFGFKADFRGFYFRSVFIPVVLIATAVYIAAFSRRMSSSRQWTLALIAIMLSALPMFYHFEPFWDPASLRWGLVDCFFGAISALAAAASLRSVRSGSWSWLLVATLLASFAVYVKPAGTIVMGCLGLTWFAMSVARWLQTRSPKEKHRAFAMLLAGSLWSVLLYAAVLVSCLSSNYLSVTNLAFGTSAVAIMRAELHLPLDLLPMLLRTSFGYMPLAVLGLLLSAVMWKQRPSGVVDDPAATRVLGHFLAACFYIAVGLWFWLIWSGGATEIRYFFPFALMAMVVILPPSLVLLDRLPHLRMLVRILSAAWACNLAVLLALPEPPMNWQRQTGINLASGLFLREIGLAKDFARHVQSSGREALVYSTFSSPGVSVIENELMFETQMNPALPGVYVARPMDWRRPSTFRLEEILGADYILFNPFDRPCPGRQATDFHCEIAAFNSSFATLAPDDGVETVFETSNCRLLRVVNAARLEESLDRLVKVLEWGQAFSDANPQRWWSQQQVWAANVDSSVVARNIRFGDVFDLEAMSIKSMPDHLAVRLWMRPLHGSRERWFMFFHQLNSNGQIIDNYEVPLSQEQAPHSDRPILLTDTDVAVQHRGAVRVIAIGIRSRTSILAVDSGVRDWNNRRLIVPLPSLAQ